RRPGGLLTPPPRQRPLPRLWSRPRRDRNRVAFPRRRPPTHGETGGVPRSRGGIRRPVPRPSWRRHRLVRHRPGGPLTRAAPGGRWEDRAGFTKRWPRRTHGGTAAPGGRWARRAGRRPTCPHPPSTPRGGHSHQTGTPASPALARAVAEGAASATGITPGAGTNSSKIGRAHVRTPVT